MCTALAPRIGYDNAAALAKTAYRDGTTIREMAHALVGLDADRIAGELGEPASADVLREHGGFPSATEIDRLLDPMSQTERGMSGTGGGG
jgi:fumarate hydratase class II